MSSGEIQNVDSAPDYIHKFIHMNMEQLCKIYDEGMYNNPDLEKGILCFQCSEKENKMDVRNKTLIVRIGLAMLKDG